MKIVWNILFEKQTNEMSILSSGVHCSKLLFKFQSTAQKSKNISLQALY